MKVRACDLGFLRFASRARGVGLSMVGCGVGISRGSGETVARSTDIRRICCSGVSAPLKDGATIFGSQAATVPPFSRGACPGGGGVGISRWASETVSGAQAAAAFPHH
jgi:hypothetical protein